MPTPEILNVEPREAVEFFRAKGYHVSFSWKDTEALEHAGSFTVAKVAEMDMLREIRGAADKALAEGTTFEAFRDELEPFLRRRGWWGRQIVDGRVVQLGSVHRLLTIFQTNLRTSYAAGQWERIQRVRDDLPFLRSSAVLDSRTRPWLNDRTSEVQNVQVGIDPGWNHNTGALASRIPLTASLHRPSRQTRLGVSKSAKGYFRSRLFLASTRRPRV